MAGIGFELRRLTRKDDLLGIIEGYSYSATLAAGPWMFTIITLAGIVLVGSVNVPQTEINLFQIIIIYNFAFSLALSGPFVMVGTRVLADEIYFRDVHHAPAVLLGYMAMMFAVQAIPVGLFYFVFVDMDFPTRLAAAGNFFLISGIWLISTFSTALKDFRTVARSFLAGMATGFLAAIVLSADFGVIGMLVGFTAGLTVIFFTLIARVIEEYPYPVVFPFEYEHNFTKYKELAFSGLVYNMAIWVDKWVMWFFAPERVVLQSRMVSYPDYDVAMFLAYVSVLPSLAVFFLNIETHFFEKYLVFYRDIQKHATFKKILENEGGLVEAVLAGARNLVVLQGSVSLLVILLAPTLFEVFNVPFGLLGIFRIGVLGAFFHVLFLSMTILLSYFDLRSLSLRVHLFFLVSNVLFTLVTLQLGYPYYGLGYFFSTLLTFVLTFIVTAGVLEELPYRTFVLGNESVLAEAGRGHAGT